MQPEMINMRVRCPDADPESLHELTHSLRRAVLNADVDDVRPGTAGTAPAGAKSGEALAVGALVVTLAPIVVEAMMAVVSSWLSRQPSEVEVEVDGHRFRGRITRAQRDKVVASFLRRLDREP